MQTMSRKAPNASIDLPRPDRNPAAAPSPGPNPALAPVESARKWKVNSVSGWTAGTVTPAVSQSKIPTSRDTGTRAVFFSMNEAMVPRLML